MSNHPMVETVPPPDFDENLHIWSIWSEKKMDHLFVTHLPNNRVLGKVLSEIWALKVLLKQPKLARPPHKKPATTLLSVTLELHSPTILFMISSGSMYLSALSNSLFLYNFELLRSE